MIKQIDVSAHPAFDGHEKVFYFEDTKAKLRGYIAIHSLKLGPATGGTRYFPYKKDMDAVKDVLMLSKAMTYKCALTGLPFSGGKAVIIGDPKNKTPELLQAYAKVIDSLKGKYTTGTDVGVSDEDTKYMSKFTPYILKGSGGKVTTSGMASLGVYFALRESVAVLLPHKKMSDITVAIKGVGKIGHGLATLLAKDGVKLFVADVNKQALADLKKEIPGIKIVTPEAIHKTKADVYAPCALGGEFTAKNIGELKATIIVGGANNQLTKNTLAEALQKKGIWYIPDYVVNAGGLIQIVDELRPGGYNKLRARKAVETIGRTTGELIQGAFEKKSTPLAIAEERAHTILHASKKNSK